MRHCCFTRYAHAPTVRVMAALPTVVPAAISAELETLERLAVRAGVAELNWLSGWFAGWAAARGAGDAAVSIASNGAVATPVPAREPAALRLTVLYGSQTGNARRVAERIAARAEESGLAVRAVSTADFAVRELANERFVVVAVSTQGDGDPPDTARAFIDALESRRAPSLAGLRYAVVALGDSSYPRYCAFGQRVDERFAALGATRLAERFEADLDFDETTGPWIAATADAAKAAADALAIETPRLATVTPIRPVASAPAGARAEVVANVRITADESDHDIRHVELSLTGSSLRYLPGDALGFTPRNDALTVDDVLDASALDAATTVELDGTSATLREWLTAKRELTRLSRPVVAALAPHAGGRLDALLAPEARTALAEILSTYQVADLIRARGIELDAATLVRALRPIVPRLYSIASSPEAVGDEAHLTVKRVDYDAFGRRHVGAATSALAAVAEGDALDVHIQANAHFRLPDPDTDVILVGAGTGVAPYRGFVQQRGVARGRGRTWLVFGERRFASDFLYQLEWQDALRQGALSRLDVAFSRDAAEHRAGSDATSKTYVQHRLVEHGAEVHRWLEAGAHVYVCGDAKRLAPGVHDALASIVGAHGARDAESVREYLTQLTASGRYHRDVY